MKNTIIMIAAVFLIVGCTDKNGSQQSTDALTLILQEHMQNGIDTTGVSAVYNKEKECIELSWEGEIMTVSYNTYYKGTPEEKMKSYADGFNISMLVLKQGATKVSHMELTIGNRSYVLLPFVVEPIGNDFIVAGFNSSEESVRICLELLANTNSIVEAKVYTDKGSVKIPINDVFNLMGMAKSYIMDGGKFE